MNIKSVYHEDDDHYNDVQLKRAYGRFHSFYANFIPREKVGCTYLKEERKGGELTLNIGQMRDIKDKSGIIVYSTVFPEYMNTLPLAVSDSIIET